MNARRAMTESMISLIRRNGIEGTSLSDVLKDSGAPRGSIYHHFPEGKSQLAEEATQLAGEWALAFIDSMVNASLSPAKMIDKLAAAWRLVLEESNYEAGCPVLAAAVAGPDSAKATSRAAHYFSQWQRAVGTALSERGLGVARSESLAALIIASFEGAIVMCRAQKSTEPLDHISRELSLACQAAIGIESPAGTI